jgi:uncharacterized membrane protein YhhN
MTWILIGITFVGLIAVLAAEHAGQQLPQWVAKPLASAGFVAFAAIAAVRVADDPTLAGHARWILVGTVLSWAGDVLLIPKKTSRAFLLGLVAFLAAHVAYAGAFLALGVPDARAWWIALPLAVVAAVILRWLWPRLDRRFRIAVPAYMAVISTMLACAVAASPRPGGWAIAAGAGLFYLSDLFVARNRFVAPGFVNRAVGLPLYYTGQWLLVVSILTVAGRAMG